MSTRYGGGGGGGGFAGSLHDPLAPPPAFPRGSEEPIVLHPCSCARLAPAPSFTPALPAVAQPLDRRRRVVARTRGVLPRSWRTVVRDHDAVAGTVCGDGVRVAVVAVAVAPALGRSTPLRSTLDGGVQQRWAPRLAPALTVGADRPPHPPAPRAPYRAQLVFNRGPRRVQERGSGRDASRQLCRVRRGGHRGRHDVPLRPRRGDRARRR